MSRKRSRRRRTGPKKAPGDATSSKATFATWAKDEEVRLRLTTLVAEARWFFRPVSKFKKGVFSVNL
jgi:hypothetical protein